MDCIPLVQAECRSSSKKREGFPELSQGGVCVCVDIHMLV